jgi:hypothetical protein
MSDTRSTSRNSGLLANRAATADLIQKYGLRPVLNNARSDEIAEFTNFVICALRGQLDNQQSAASEKPAPNLERNIAEFATLQDGWNSYGAKAFPEATIALALEIARKLGDEWNVVPVADGGIQFFRGDEEDIVEVRTSYE